MAKLKARIEWQVFNDNEDVISSSYENISDIEDAQAWVSHMEDILEENLDEED